MRHERVYDKINNIKYNSIHSQLSTQYAWCIIIDHLES